MTDRELLEHAQRGDAAAWRELYARLVPIAWSAALARTGDRAASEDIVSETLLALVRHLPNLDPETCRLYGWLNQVIRSKATDWARRNKSQRKAINGFSHEPEHRPPSDPAGRAIRIEERHAVVLVLEELSEDYRVVLEMKYAQGATVKDIADRLDLSVKAAESLLHRARTDFRSKYKFNDKREEMPALPSVPRVAACHDSQSEPRV